MATGDLIQTHSMWSRSAPLKPAPVMQTVAYLPGFVSIPVDRRAGGIKEAKARAEPQNPENRVGPEKVTCDRAGIYSALRSGGVYSCGVCSS